MGMRWLRLRLGTLTYEDWLLFCFTAGIFCGTAAALAFGGPTVQGCILGAAGSFGSGNRGVKEYITVFRQRALETCGGWLAGVTVCSQMLFGFLTFYAGMSLAVVLSVLTIRKGCLLYTSYHGPQYQRQKHYDGACQEWYGCGPF